MAATRFPDKPLAKINGIPMIGHVYHRVRMCQNLADAYVATCDKEIFNYITSIGGKPVLTKDTHERATERTGEAFEKIMEITGNDFDGVLMIQGDEPLLNPALLDDMISFHINQISPYITNLISEIHNLDEFNNPNVVKVVKDNNGRILYFSRSPIPSNLKFSKKHPRWKQLGIILFSNDALNTYNELEPTELEIIESVDMNRVLENDLIITAFPTNEISHAVDVPEDIPLLEQLFINDMLINNYA